MDTLIKKCFANFAHQQYIISAGSQVTAQTYVLDLLMLWHLAKHQGQIKSCDKFLIMLND